MATRGATPVRELASRTGHNKRECYPLIGLAAVRVTPEERSRLVRLAKPFGATTKALVSVGNFRPNPPICPQGAELAQMWRIDGDDSRRDKRRDQRCRRRPSASPPSASMIAPPGAGTTDSVKLPLSLNGPMASVTNMSVLNVPLMRTEP